MADCFLANTATGREIFLASFLPRSRRSWGAERWLMAPLPSRWPSPYANPTAIPFSLWFSLSLYCFLPESKRPSTILLNAQGHWLHLSDGQPIPQAFIHSFLYALFHPAIQQQCLFWGHSNSKTNKTWDFIFAGHRGVGGPDNKKTGNTAIHTFIRNIKSYIHTV